MSSIWGKNVLGNLSMDIIKAHSFPRATLPENCSLFGTDNHARGQISEHILTPTLGCRLYIQPTVVEQLPIRPVISNTRGP